MDKKSIVYLILAAALIASVAPAAANLVPTTFGFPVIVQNGSTSAFNQDTATATDFENINIDIPVFDHFNAGDVNNDLDLGGTAISAGDLTATANALPFGPVDLAFPSISQTVDQTQAVTHTDFAQTNEYAEFAYPFVAAGPVSLPGFGFGF